MKNTVRIFFGGDVCGKMGAGILEMILPELIAKKEIDFTVVNGENTYNGAGIRDCEAELFFECGVDVITGGNHTLEKFDIRDNFGLNPKILRPHNYPYANGSGFVIAAKDEVEYAVINIQGRENMRPINCPFQTVENLLKQLTDKNSEALILVDFHAESVQEKEAMGFFLDGRVSFVGGTHTHTQTADNKILPNGTGYITDTGMIGSYNSVIGSTPESSIRKAKTQVPQKFDMAESGAALFSGIIIDVNVKTKKTIKTERIRIVN